MNSTKKCNHCNGCGTEPGTNRECTQCFGRGYLPTEGKRRCPRCGGSTTEIGTNRECPDCRGTGEIDA